MAYLCGVRNSLWLLIILVCSSGAFATDVPAGNVSGTWTLANSPYLINGNIRLAPNDTLHIEPGVDVIFQSQYYFRILGNFEALGAAGDSVSFTAPTNNPGWFGIKLDSLAASSDTARFEYCRISNMKNGGINVINTSKVVFNHCRIYDNLDMYIGAIYTALGSISLSHCTFQNNDSNSGAEGSAMYIWDASPTIVDCDFIGNSSPWSSGAIALYRDDFPTEPQFINCQFIDNWTYGSGGAVVSHSNCLPYYENCSFIGNTSSYDGGAIWDGYTQVGSTQYVNCIFRDNTSTSEGGSVYLVSTKSTFINCEFSDNVEASVQGGVLYAYDECDLVFEQCRFTDNYTNGQGTLHLNDYSTMTMNRCLFSNNRAILGGAMVITSHSEANITNSIFVNNEAVNVGGALRIVQFSHPTISNCLFAHNKAGITGGALTLYWECDPILTNCIFWNNVAGEELNTYDVQEYIWNYCTPTFDHCCIENGEASFTFGDSGPGIMIESITDDPLFILPSESVGLLGNAAEGNWHFAAEVSPCEDGGTADVGALNLGDWDYEGGVRLLGTVDIGPYEGGETVLPYEEIIDLNGDGVINIADLLEFLGSFGCLGPDCAGDLNGDEVVNATDLLIFIQLFSL
jgi:hypothetical protein